MRVLVCVMALCSGLAFAQAKAPSGKTEVTWYGHAAFRVKAPNGTVLLIDPWLKNPAAKGDPLAGLDKADFILVTHAHFDHVGEAVEIARKTKAKFVGAFELGATLAQNGYPPEQTGFATMGNLGGTFKLNDEVSVTLVPAVHSSGYQKDEKSPFSSGGAPGGFVIQIRNGPTLYHTGDTDVFSDMRLIGDRFKIDVMLACVGGHFTMDPSAAALATCYGRPTQIVPMHFCTFPVLTGTPAELAKQLKAKGVKTKLVEMQVGETRTF